MPIVFQSRPRPWRPHFRGVAPAPRNSIERGLLNKANEPNYERIVSTLVQGASSSRLQDDEELYSLIVSMAVSQPLYTKVYAHIARDLGLDRSKLVSLLDQSYGSLRLLAELWRNEYVEDDLVKEKISQFKTDFDVERLCKLTVYLGREWEERNSEHVQGVMDWLEMHIDDFEGRRRFLIEEVFDLQDRGWENPPRLFLL